ncbi:carboxypeptidase-like regulatory domain-containing protein, partial [Fulvivirgaceae bacterium PWU4]
MKLLIAGVLFILTHITYSQTSVKGRVFDGETKEPLAGVSILVQNAQTGITTASDGTFTITSAQPLDSLEVRYIGYQSQKIKAHPGEPLNIGLVASVTTMKEVVVTASRDEQLRTDAPMAINKLSPTTLSDAKPTLIVELINKVPGVAMLNYNNEQHAMAIRQPMGTNAYFLYMEDGIPLRPMGVFNHNALIEMNILAISNIEVVKGPASSLYGPEAVGGVINFISQKPTAVPTARVGLQFDNFGYKRVQYGA